MECVCAIAFRKSSRRKYYISEKPLAELTPNFLCRNRDYKNDVHRRQYSSEPVSQIRESGNQGTVGSSGEQTA